MKSILPKRSGYMPIIPQSLERASLILMAFFFSFSSYSQQITVTGTVTDPAGETIPGVNILEKGTSNGTVTDLDGAYSLNVAGPEAVLVFSFVGFTTQ